MEESAKLQKQAKDLFLDREGVVGVGVTQEDPPQLAFLLNQSPPHVIAEIRDWAISVHAHVIFQEVGQIRG